MSALRRSSEFRVIQNSSLPNRDDDHIEVKVTGHPSHRAASSAAQSHRSIHVPPGIPLERLPQMQRLLLGFGKAPTSGTQNAHQDSANCCRGKCYRRAFCPLPLPLAPMLLMHKSSDRGHSQPDCQRVLKQDITNRQRRCWRAFFEAPPISTGSIWTMKAVQPHLIRA